MSTIFSGTGRRKADVRFGFTLVELLVVIAIIGVLVALIMPAINAVQESGRRAQCQNNVRTLAQACTAHENKLNFFPSGGWGKWWAGNPDAGFGAAQPGGWLYNILPFMDLNDLHDTGKGGTNKTVGGTRTLIVVREFLCRTRHGRDQAFPFSGAYINVTNPTGAVGRCDYAANAGSNFVDPGPFGSPGANSMGGNYNPNFAWGNYPGSITSSSGQQSTGVIFRASMVPSAMIKDGPSYTYLLGERYMTVDYYNQSPEGEVTAANPPASENDTGWDSGYDYNTIRWTGVGEITTSSSSTPLAPSQDQSLRNMPGVTAQTIALFGSAHGAGFYMAFADGRVQLINYNIDPNTHMYLGNRNDGEPTNWSMVSGN